MGLGIAVQTLNAGKPCQILQFIDIGRIHRVGFLATFLCQIVGQHDTQLGRMFAAALFISGIFIELFVDLHDARSNRHRRSASSDKDIDLRQVQILFFQEIQNDLLSKRDLTIDMRILQ